METLCAHYHYVNQAAHRAYDDALATAVVFEQMEERIPTEEEIFQPQQLQFKDKRKTSGYTKTKEVSRESDEISCDRGVLRY